MNNTVEEISEKTQKETVREILLLLYSELEHVKEAKRKDQHPINLIGYAAIEELLLTLKQQITDKYLNKKRKSEGYKLRSIQTG